MYPHMKEFDSEPWLNDNDDFMNASSGTDCTGLIPAKPSSEQEENYNELYDFLPNAVVDSDNPRQ